jgi:hypothetical protein
MEDPITFDIWGRLIAERRSNARAVLQRVNPELSDKAVLQALVRASNKKEPLLLASDLGWGDAQACREEMGAYFDDIKVFQHRFGPPQEARMKYCADHRLYFSGIFGCPICEGRNAP